MQKNKLTKNQVFLNNKPIFRNNIYSIQDLNQAAQAYSNYISLYTPIQEQINNKHLLIHRLPLILKAKKLYINHLYTIYIASIK